MDTQFTWLELLERTDFKLGDLVCSLTTVTCTVGVILDESVSRLYKYVK